MSALDFGDGTGVNSGANRRQFTFTMPALGNNDWCIAAWVRMNNNRGVNFSAIGGHGANDVSSAEGWRMNMASDTTLSFTARQAGGTTKTMTFSHGGIDSNDYLCVLQRRSANFEAYFCLKGASASTVGSTAHDGTTISTHTGRIGMNNFNFADGWPNPLGEFMVVDGSSLAAADVTAMAVGARWTGTPQILFPFRDGNVATETNLGSAGGSATRVLNGTAVFGATEADFFALTTPRIVVPTVAVSMR